MAHRPRPFDNLFAGFLDSVQDFPERPALVVDSDVLTYTDLHERARRLSHTIRAHDPNPECRLVACLAHRSVTAYSAVIGILGAGKGYVPLHPGFPVERTQRMLDRSGVRVLIVGAEGHAILPELLSAAKHSLTVISPDSEDPDRLQEAFPQHTFVGLEQPPHDPHVEDRVSPEATAYLLFTSGSTGVPKGVPISQRNVTSYLHHVRRTYDITPDDRVSQMFDMTFDLSVHDMFLCWTSGACLFCVPERAVMAPAKFIRDHRLTVWFSVPSVIGFMQRLRLLKPNAFPDLRLSLFCGEPLLATMADAWQRAAPHSRVENLYGPTEATIAITRFVWDHDDGATDGSSDTTNGVVCIGHVFPTQCACVIDDRQRPVAPGEPGELCVSGSQVTSRYLDDEPKTREQFVTLPGQGEKTWYRTGDLARQADDGRFHYLGRLDSQVQVRGHRVELLEVDHVLRQASGTDAAVSLAWPVRSHRVDAIYAFVSTDERVDTQHILGHCRRALPEYATPRDVFPVEQIPVNANGKIDRSTLEQHLEEILNGPR